MTTLTEYKVSVLMTTYCHVRWIEQAVDSVLGQRASFPFELVVGDDASDDGTRERLIEAAGRDARLRLVLPPRNYGDRGKRLFAETIRAAGGRYLAMLDGDDFWTSPDKLQIQSDFLDAHDDVVMCFHNAERVSEDGAPLHTLYRQPEDLRRTGLEPMLQSCFVPACSPMFRREVIDPLPDWYFDVPFGDWPLYILAAERGRIAYLDRCLAAYRVHDAGMWTARTREQQLRSVIAFLQQVDALTDRRHHAVFRGGVARHRFQLARLYRQEGRTGAAWRTAVAALRADPSCRYTPRAELVRLILRPRSAGHPDRSATSDPDVHGSTAMTGVAR